MHVPEDDRGCLCGIGRVAFEKFSGTPLLSNNCVIVSAAVAVSNYAGYCRLFAVCRCVEFSVPLVRRCCVFSIKLGGGFANSVRR